MAEWQGIFNVTDMTQLSETVSVDKEGRHWEFFGYVIPLYDDPHT